MQSLGTIRARVEQLASAWPTSPETLFVHWGGSVRAVPVLWVRSEGPRAGGGVGRGCRRSRAERTPADLVFYSTDELTTCPRCGATLPS
jgi:hypothetical protein